MPKSRSSSSGATMENSTIACERWLPRAGRASTISVAADCHVRVGDHVDRAAEDAFHKPGREPEVHDQDHVYVRGPVAVVGGGRCDVQPWGVRVADIEERLIDARCGIRRAGIWRVVAAVAVGGGR